MKLKTVIVEDEPKSLALMENHLKRFSSEVEVVGTACSALEGAETILDVRPDLVFLDICMPGESGLDMLKRFPNPDFQVVFTTAYRSYALDAFDSRAVHYLLKPIDLCKLHEAIQRVLHSREMKQTERATEMDAKKITVPVKEGYQVLSINDIIRCEGDGSYTTFFMKGGSKVVACLNIKRYEEQLNACLFMRVHKRHLVSINYIDSVTKGKGGYIIISDGSKIAVSFRRKAELMEKLRSIGPE